MSIDPGKTTGYALGVLDTSKLYLAAGQAEMDVWAFAEFVRKYKCDFYIIEDFEFRQRARAGLELFSVQLIGVARLCCPNIYIQKAARGKSYYTDPQLKSLNLYPTSYKHGRDALRHLLHWFTFGAGFQFNEKQTMELVGEAWLREAYFRG